MMTFNKCLALRIKMFKYYSLTIRIKIVLNLSLLLTILIIFNSGLCMYFIELLYWCLGLSLWLFYLRVRHRIFVFLFKFNWFIHLKSYCALLRLDVLSLCVNCFIFNINFIFLFDNYFIRLTIRWVHLF